MLVRHNSFFSSEESTRLDVRVDGDNVEVVVLEFLLRGSRDISRGSLACVAGATAT